MTSAKAMEAKKKGFPEILRQNMGFILRACAQARISPTTYYKWRSLDEAFAKECDEAEIYTGTFVKEKLYELIEEKETAAVIFYCKTKLKHEGFVERVEQTGKDGAAIITENKLAESDQALLNRFVKNEVNKALGAMNHA